MKKTYTHTCRYCKKPFESTAFWARYCNDSHRQMDYAKRKKKAEQQKPSPDKEA